MVFFVKKESGQSNSHLETTWTVWVSVLLPVLLRSLVCQSCISLGDLDELSYCERVVWVLVRMLQQTKLSVSSLNGCSVCISVHSQYLEGIEGLQRLDLADLVSSDCPKSPKEYGNEEFEEESWSQPRPLVCLLSLLYSLLTTRALTVLTSEFELLLSEDHSLQDVVGQRNEDHSQN